MKERAPQGPNQGTAPNRRTQCRQIKYLERKSSPLHQTGASPEKIAKFRKENPEIGKTLTDQDILGIVRGKNKADVKLNGEQAPHDKSQADRVSEKSKLGIEAKIEAQHSATVADLTKKPDVNKAEDAELAALAKRSAANEPAPQPKKADADDKTSQPGPSKSKQALRSNSSGPKIT
jgi:hypothetical protein